MYNYKKDKQGFTYLTTPSYIESRFNKRSQAQKEFNQQLIIIALCSMGIILALIF